VKLRAGWQKAVVALANKNAGILWSIMTKGTRFERNHKSSPLGSPMTTRTLDVDIDRNKAVCRVAVCSLFGASQARREYQYRIPLTKESISCHGRP
jgi:hypothetical protein